MTTVTDVDVWSHVREEAVREALHEPVLARFLEETVLARASLEEALAFVLAFLDHGTSLVIGETAVVEDDVSMLHEVSPHTTVAGVPARPVGRPATALPALEMDQALDGDGGAARRGRAG